MKNFCTYLLVLLSIHCLRTTTFAETEPKPIGKGTFHLSLDKDNAHLPNQIQLMTADGPVEILDRNCGLNFTFTDFQNRNKFYREESNQAWPNKNEPRFVTEPSNVSEPVKIDEGQTEGYEVRFDTSYARFTRRILAHKQQDRLTIEYEMTPFKDMQIHELGMFGFNIRFAPQWNQIAITDARPDSPTWLKQSDVKNPHIAVTAHHSGPMVISHAGSKISLLITPRTPANVPTNLWRIKAGGTDTYAVDIELADAAQPERLPDSRRPFTLLANGRMLLSQGQRKQAEQALLQAAQLNQDFATPYMVLANMRQGKQADGELSSLTFAEAWVKGAYRMPYNYGYILSGSGFYQDKRLTEHQRRQAILNMLIAVENAAFYPDYYVWAARPFEGMKMHSQACAMYRQGLWALDHMPRPESYKQKVRTRFEKKIAELEEKILNEEVVLPPLLPVKVSPQDN